MPNDMSDEVYERLLPHVMQLLERNGLKPGEIRNVSADHYINEDRSHLIKINHWSAEHGVRLMARLNPDCYGLALIGDELVTLLDPVDAFKPLPEY